MLWLLLLLWSDFFCNCVNGLSDYNIVLIEDRRLWFKGDEHLKDILVTILQNTYKIPSKVSVAWWEKSKRKVTEWNW